MNFKRVVSSLLIALTLTGALPAKKAEAGVSLSVLSVGGALIAGPLGLCNMEGCYTAVILGAGGLGLGVISTITGAVVAFLNPTVGVGLIILSEDGSLSQSDLEQVLSQKYSFVQDPTVIADLASMIKEKAEMVSPVDGKIMVSISRAEVLSLIEGTDLLETHSTEVQKMIQDLN